MNYYNEFDPKAAAWLRELIKGGHIPFGIVDERSITEIQPHELAEYTQCHFFAGIGGWSLALQLANWPATRPVGTGSCPCQPFSSAGKQLGGADERHLWPVFFRLIVGCRALGQQWAFTVFGEQVANAIGKGWLDGISTDLESEGYACGAVVLGAHSVGAPHIRQRLYWVAQSTSEQPHWSGDTRGGRGEFADSGTILGLADASDVRGAQQWDESREGSRRGEGPHDSAECSGLGFWSNFDILPCTDGKARRIESGTFPLAHGVSGRVGLLRGYGNAIVPEVAAEFIVAFNESTNQTP